MFEIRDGIILTDEVNHMDDVGKIVVMFGDGRVIFVCRNKGINSVYWQISGTTSWRKHNLYFDESGVITKEKMIDTMLVDWPEDLIWLLFHPEIYDGGYDG